MAEIISLWNFARWRLLPLGLTVTHSNFVRRLTAHILPNSAIVAQRTGAVAIPRPLLGDFHRLFISALVLLSLVLAAVTFYRNVIRESKEVRAWERYVTCIICVPRKGRIFWSVAHSNLFLYSFVTVCGPPPTAYDPKFPGGGAGPASFPKEGRFRDASQEGNVR